MEIIILVFLREGFSVNYIVYSDRKQGREFTFIKNSFM